LRPRGQIAAEQFNSLTNWRHPAGYQFDGELDRRRAVYRSDAGEFNAPSVFGAAARGDLLMVHPRGAVLPSLYSADALRRPLIRYGRPNVASRVSFGVQF